jgi:hypothetical protein
MRNNSVYQVALLYYLKVKIFLTFLLSGSDDQQGSR